MNILILSFALASVFFMNHIVKIYSKSICKDNSFPERKESLFIIFTALLLLIISYLNINNSWIFLKAAVMDTSFVAVSALDIKYKLIPDKLVILILTAAVLCLAVGDISIMNSAAGAAAGGGLLLLFSLIPGAMGGGDVKFMFVLGIFLGLNKTLTALIIAFILSSCFSLFTLIFKIKTLKDSIAFGPFLAIGGFIAYHFFV